MRRRDLLTAKLFLTILHYRNQIHNLLGRTYKGAPRSWLAGFIDFLGESKGQWELAKRYWKVRLISYFVKNYNSCDWRHFVTIWCLFICLSCTKETIRKFCEFLYLTFFFFLTGHLRLFIQAIKIAFWNTYLVFLWSFQGS